jgi:hypothetical protein
VATSGGNEQTGHSPLPSSSRPPREDENSPAGEGEDEPGNPVVVVSDVTQAVTASSSGPMDLDKSAETDRREEEVSGHSKNDKSRSKAKQPKPNQRSPKRSSKRTPGFVLFRFDLMTVFRSIGNERKRDRGGGSFDGWWLSDTDGTGATCRFDGGAWIPG